MSDELDSFPPMHPNIQGIGRERARKVQQGAESVPPQLTPAVPSAQPDTDPDLLAAPRFSKAVGSPNELLPWLTSRTQLLVIGAIGVIIVFIGAYLLVRQHPNSRQATTIPHSLTKTPTGHPTVVASVPTQNATPTPTPPISTTLSPQPQATLVPPISTSTPVSPTPIITPIPPTPVQPTPTLTPLICTVWSDGPNTNSYTAEPVNNYHLTTVLQGLFSTVTSTFCGEFRTVDTWWVPASAFTNGTVVMQTVVYNASNQTLVNEVIDSPTFSYPVNTVQKVYGSVIRGTCARGIGTVTAPSFSPVQVLVPWNIPNQDANGNHIWCP